MITILTRNCKLSLKIMDFICGKGFLDLCHGIRHWVFPLNSVFKLKLVAAIFTGNKPVQAKHVIIREYRTVCYCYVDQSCRGQ